MEFHTALSFGKSILEAWHSNPIVGTIVFIMLIGGLFGGGQDTQYIEYYDHDQ